MEAELAQIKSERARHPDHRRSSAQNAPGTGGRIQQGAGNMQMGAENSQRGTGGSSSSGGPSMMHSRPVVDFRSPNQSLRAPPAPPLPASETAAAMLGSLDQMSAERVRVRPPTTAHASQNYIHEYPHAAGHQRPDGHQRTDGQQRPHRRERGKYDCK